MQHAAGLTHRKSPGSPPFGCYRTTSPKHGEEATKRALRSWFRLWDSLRIELYFYMDQQRRYRHGDRESWMVIKSSLLRAASQISRNLIQLFSSCGVGCSQENCTCVHPEICLVEAPVTCTSASAERLIIKLWVCFCGFNKVRRPKSSKQYVTTKIERSVA